MPLRFLVGTFLIEYLPIVQNSYLHLPFLKMADYPFSSIRLFALVCLGILAYRLRDDTCKILVDEAMIKSASGALFSGKYLKISNTLYHWRRQLAYDLTIYCLPLVALGLAFPSSSIIRKVCNFILVFCTFYMPVYNNLVVKYFLHVSAFVLVDVYSCILVTKFPLMYSQLLQNQLKRQHLD